MKFAVCEVGFENVRLRIARTVDFVRWDKSFVVVSLGTYRFGRYSVKHDNVLIVIRLLHMVFESRSNLPRFGFRLGDPYHRYVHRIQYVLTTSSLLGPI